MKAQSLSRSAAEEPDRNSNQPSSSDGVKQDQGMRGMDASECPDLASGGDLVELSEAEVVAVVRITRPASHGSHGLSGLSLAAAVVQDADR